VLELPNKSERVIAFAWEPKGHRFAVVHGDTSRPNVSFYSMKDAKGKLGVHLVGESPSSLMGTGRDWGLAGGGVQGEHQRDGAGASAAIAATRGKLQPVRRRRLCPPPGTLPSKSVNGLHWSPAGHNIVLSGLKTLNGQVRRRGRGKGGGHSARSRAEKGALKPGGGSAALPRAHTCARHPPAHPPTHTRPLTPAHSHPP
jgi:hypothetical protein